MRVYFVARHKAHERNGRTSLLPAALGVLTLAGVAFALMPQPRGTPHRAGFAANGGLRTHPGDRCAAVLGCHSAQPDPIGIHSRLPTACCSIHPSASWRTPSRCVSRSPPAPCPWATLPASPNRSEPKCSPGSNVAPRTDLGKPRAHRGAILHFRSDPGARDDPGSFEFLEDGLLVTATATSRRSDRLRSCCRSAEGCRRS